MEGHSAKQYGTAIGWPGALAHARKNAKLSQAELAAATRRWAKEQAEEQNDPALAESLPIAESTIAMLERGRRQPSPQVLTTLAAVLDRPVESIGRILVNGETQCSHCRGAGAVAS